MRPAARTGRSALRSLFLFVLYVAALWAVTWYSLHYYHGAYNTIISDVLLTLAFAAAFFPPLLVPRCSRRRIALFAAPLLLLSVVALFALRPPYTVKDGYQILSAAQYEQVQLENIYLPQTRTSLSHPLVSSGIVYQATQGSTPHEILFDPASGTYFDLG